METDREVLIWFHDRLTLKYKESELFDYMHRLRAIILATPANQHSAVGVCYDMDDLRRQLAEKDAEDKETTWWRLFKS